MAKTAVVTGGSRGIGREIVKALAEDGFNVVFNYIGDPKTAKETISSLSDYTVEAYEVDVTDPEGVKSFADTVIKKHGGIDVLVNNAGIAIDKLFMRMTLEDWKKVIDVNLNGSFLVTNAFIRHLLRSKAGRIVFMSSVIAFKGNVGQTNYAASKAGLIGFMKSLAKEIAPKGVTCNAILPGAVGTDMVNNLKDEWQEQLKSNIPLKRFAEPCEIAKLVSYLAGENGSYITGQTFTIDGGLTI